MRLPGRSWSRCCNFRLEPSGHCRRERSRSPATRPPRQRTGRDARPGRPAGPRPCSPAKARPWLLCSGRWLRSTGTGSPPPGRCPSATSQPSCGHARPPAGNVDRLRRPNRNSRPDRAAHRLRNSKGSGGISKARATESSQRQVAHIRPAMGYAHNRAMCAHSISSSARHITEQIRQGD